MAEASRIFHTLLIPTFSQNPSHPFLNKTPGSLSHSIFKRNILIRCSITTTNTNADTTKKPTGNPQKIPWGCDMDSPENASGLQKWLSHSGLPPQKMGIEKVEVGERGLVAFTNIRKGEKLLFVPPPLFITADSVRFFH